MKIISTFVLLLIVVSCVHADEYSPYCTERLYAGSGVIKSPGFPGKYESDMKCSWLIHTNNNNHITLDFTSFDIEAATGCYYDYVEVFDGGSNNDRSLGKFCGPDTPRDLTASGNMLFVEFKTDSSVEKGGFSANFSEGCSWTFNGLEGDFHSPNYPINYMDGVQCTYKFNAPPGKRIRISFMDFKLEGKSPNSRCAYDYVEIFDGESRDSNSLGRKCGRELPPDILSTTNKLFIRLTTDNSVNYGGFNAQFEAVNAGPSPCDTNNGGCEHNCRPSGDNQPDCFCRDGFVLDIDGKSCNDIDECAVSQPCEQICRNLEGSYMCSCLPGYTLNQNGLTCKDVNECNSNNGGCEEVCSNVRGSFRCSCSSPNKVLQDDQVSCAEPEPSPCDIGNGGCQQYCRVTENNQAECYCRDGFRLQYDQQSCQDINECQQGLNPCGQLCFNTEGSFMCSCQLGYKLMENGLQCKDINECHIHNGGCGEDCVNLRGSFRCRCSSPNRVLHEDKQTCRERSECEMNNGGCQHICSKSMTGIYCSCHLGFELKEDGKGCRDINECLRPPSQLDIHSNQCNQLCINTPGSYYCDCEDGFELSPNARVCKDFDECASQLRLRCDQDCVNFAGGYRCQCFDGYSQEEDGCQDINECDPKPEDCHTCTNLPGSFTCQCNPGFVPNENQTSCLDINECMINNGGCQHVCANSLGGHKCRCRAGFQGTDRTNRVCVDINECQNSDDNKGPCNHHCLNSLGSFQCLCEEGYYLNDDGVTCLDIDECLDDNGDCSQQCINTPGSYSCQCFPGYEVTEDKTECIDINECATNRNGCDVSENAFCINTEGNYTCGCPLGYETYQWLHCQAIPTTVSTKSSPNPTSTPPPPPYEAVQPALLTAIPTTVSTKSSPNPTSTPLQPPYKAVQPALLTGIIIASLASVCLLILCALLIWFRKKQCRKEIRPTETSVIERDIEMLILPCIEPDVKYKGHELKPDESLDWDQRILISRGRFGQVFLCTLTTGQGEIPVAVKTPLETSSASEKEDFKAEIDLMIQLGNHHNVLGILRCKTTNDPLLIITKYIKYGNLLTFLRISAQMKKDGFFGDSAYDVGLAELYSISRQIASGMEYVSANKVVHGDLAARNILIGEGLIVKIADFGLGQDVYERGYIKISGGEVPLKWYSLETIFEKRMSSKSDVWSFGVVLYEIFTYGKAPYPDVIVDILPKKLQRGYRMKQPENCPPQVYSIMKKCWKKSPDKRPTFENIYKEFDSLLAGVTLAKHHYLSMENINLVVEESEENAYMNVNKNIESKYENSASSSSTPIQPALPPHIYMPCIPDLATEISNVSSQSSPYNIPKYQPQDMNEELEND